VKRCGGSHCCVPKCTNQRGKDYRMGIKRSYYGFPMDVQRRRLWLQHIQRGDDWEPQASDTVCSDHFVGGMMNSFTYYVVVAMTRGVMAMGQRGRQLPPFLNFSLSENFLLGNLPNYNFWGRESPIWGTRGKVEILSTRYVRCRKLAAVCVG